MKPSSYVKSAEDGFENAMPKNSELLVAGNVTGPAPSGRITFRTKRRQQASARYNETDPPPRRSSHTLEIGSGPSPGH